MSASSRHASLWRRFIEPSPSGAAARLAGFSVLSLTVGLLTWAGREVATALGFIAAVVIYLVVPLIVMLGWIRAAASQQRIDEVAPGDDAIDRVVAVEQTREASPIHYLLILACALTAIGGSLVGGTLRVIAAVLAAILFLGLQLLAAPWRRRRLHIGCDGIADNHGGFVPWVDVDLDGSLLRSAALRGPWRVSARAAATICQRRPHPPQPLSSGARAAADTLREWLHANRPLSALFDHRTTTRDYRRAPPPHVDDLSELAADPRVDVAVRHAAAFGVGASAADANRAALRRHAAATVHVTSRTALLEGLELGEATRER